MIFSAIIKALLGRNRWMKIKRGYGIGINNNYAIMMPDSDREFNELALRHIDDFLNYRKGNSVVILATDEWTANSASLFSERIAAVERITQCDYNYFRHYYYCFRYGFSDRFIMMSLNDSCGKRLALARNINEIAKEDMICLGLYVIRDWESNG